MQSFKETCYLPPLKLEEAEQGLFLETQFTIAATGELEHRLKNKNAGRDEPLVWKYHAYDSYVPHLQKVGVLIGVLKKIHEMASDDRQLRISINDKINEFEKLRYPRKVLRLACFRMYGTTAHTTWVDAARSLMD